MATEKSLHAHLLSLPNELLIKMLLDEMKVHDENSHTLIARTSVYKGEKIVTHEVKCCAGCLASQSGRLSTEEYDPFKPCDNCQAVVCFQEFCSCNYRNYHPQRYLCKLCAIKEGHTMCVGCKREWGTEKCGSCSRAFCYGCCENDCHVDRMPGYDLELACSDCRIAQGEVPCEICKEIMPDAARQECPDCQKKICRGCERQKCSNGHVHAFRRRTPN